MAFDLFVCLFGRECSRTDDDDDEREKCEKQIFAEEFVMVFVEVILGYHFQLFFGKKNLYRKYLLRGRP